MNIKKHQTREFILSEKKLLESKLIQNLTNLDYRLVAAIDNLRKKKLLENELIQILIHLKHKRMVNDLNNKVCPKCLADNESTRYFCKSCGTFLDTENFEYADYELPQLKIMRVVDNLRHMQLGEEVPDSAFIPHAERVEKLQALLKISA